MRTPTHDIHNLLFHLINFLHHYESNRNITKRKIACKWTFRFTGSGFHLAVFPMIVFSTHQFYVYVSYACVCTTRLFWEKIRNFEPLIRANVDERTREWYIDIIIFVLLSIHSLHLEIKFHENVRTANFLIYSIVVSCLFHVHSIMDRKNGILGLECFDELMIIIWKFQIENRIYNSNSLRMQMTENK